jgi:hypothetical protein
LERKKVAADSGCEQFVVSSIGCHQMTAQQESA